MTKDKKILNTLAFVHRAVGVCKDFDKNYDFTCPICGGNAKASKNSYNGHHRGYCDGCEIRFME